MISNSFLRRGLVAFAGLALAFVAAATARAQGASAGVPLPEAGAYLPRGEGRLNVRIEDNSFKVYFLDAAGVPGPLGFTSARLEFEQVGNKNNDGMRPLRPSGDGTHLVAPRVFPPFNYRVRIRVLEGDRVTETLGPLVVRKIDTP